ncbi:helix-turn-helix transcriptional regulator [Mariniflexile ostreae]|uniref:Helix-turn-helix transcriptional regulator n=1 Tax=Mariniflexile ostreae TaxID=1520892 RepID=A0ABV5FEZ4_9FLAO
MENKRREIESFKEVDLRKKNLSLELYLSREVRRCEHCGLIKVDYQVLPEYGKGTITTFYLDGVMITVNDFIFHQNFIFHKALTIQALYLSFMLKGEMLIKFHNTSEEVAYEESDSFMAYIEAFDSVLKIYGNTAFKEVNLIITSDFLKKYGLNEAASFKKLTDQNLILPIGDTMFPVVGALELDYGKGLVQRLFLEAKVLEIVAMQLENYKKPPLSNMRLSISKPIKKLYHLKQFLKDNLDKNYSQHELAEKIGLSEYILKLEFKRLFNCTVNQYYYSEKMEKAKYLLQHTDWPIYQIAEAVGYKNATHFSAAFKRFYKDTPKACRVNV